ncbi:MAG: CRISPR-associated endonuclease Cas3'' [Nitrospiria bacterium]
MYYAHSRPEGSLLPEGSKDDWHLLRDHLISVGEETAKRSAYWGMKEEAQLAGLLHDVGKYTANFQKRLENKIKGVDHWSHGAYWAARYGAGLAAYAIYGHHIGIQAATTMNDLMKNTEGQKVYWNITETLEELKINFENDGLLISSNLNSSKHLLNKRKVPFCHGCPLSLE